MMASTVLAFVRFSVSLDSSTRDDCMVTGAPQPHNDPRGCERKKEQDNGHAKRFEGTLPPDSEPDAERRVEDSYATGATHGEEPEELPAAWQDQGA